MINITRLITTQYTNKLPLFEWMERCFKEAMRITGFFENKLLKGQIQRTTVKEANVVNYSDRLHRLFFLMDRKEPCDAYAERILGVDAPKDWTTNWLEVKIIQENEYWE